MLCGLFILSRAQYQSITAVTADQEAGGTIARDLRLLPRATSYFESSLSAGQLGLFKLFQLNIFCFGNIWRKFLSSGSSVQAQSLEQCHCRGSQH